MSFGFASDSGEVTAQGIMGSLRCTNPSCNNVVMQAHLMGPGIIRVAACPVCGRASEYENTSRGWTCRLLPKRPAATARKG